MIIISKLKVKVYNLTKTKLITNIFKNKKLE